MSDYTTLNIAVLSIGFAQSFYAGIMLLLKKNARLPDRILTVWLFCYFLANDDLSVQYQVYDHCLSNFPLCLRSFNVYVYPYFDRSQTAFTALLYFLAASGDRFLRFLLWCTGINRYSSLMIFLKMHR